TLTVRCQKSGALHRQVKTGTLIAFALSPNGRYLAVSTYEGEVQLWEVRPWAKRKVPVPLPPGSQRFWAVAFSPCSDYLVVGLPQPVLWEIRTKKSRTLPGTGWFNPLDLAYSPTGKFIAAPFRDGSLVAWDVANGRTVSVFPGSNLAAFSPDGRTL